MYVCKQHSSDINARVIKITLCSLKDYIYSKPMTLSGRVTVKPQRYHQIKHNITLIINTTPKNEHKFDNLIYYPIAR